MSNIPITATRFPELAIAKLGASEWRYVSRDSGSSAPFDPYAGCTGPVFKTKAEALAHLGTFAAEYGCGA